MEVARGYLEYERVKMIPGGAEGQSTFFATTYEKRLDRGFGFVEVLTSITSKPACGKSPQQHPLDRGELDRQ